MSQSAPRNSSSIPQPAYLHQPRVSLIIPALNEAKNLPHVLPRVPADIHEVILVDGGSSDDTVAVARKLLPSIRIVKQFGSGKGAALRTGFGAASGDVIVMIDADGSMDPSEIASYVQALAAGAEFVKGSRFMPGGGTADMGLIRQVGNWGLVQTVRALFGGTLTDLCYGFIGFWRDILPQLDLTADGFEIETMMVIRAMSTGVVVAEVPSFESARIHGKSNLRTIPDGWRVLTTIIREWLSRAPMPSVQPRLGRLTARSQQSD